jgi:hypothetical protein
LEHLEGLLQKNFSIKEGEIITEADEIEDDEIRPQMTFSSQKKDRKESF